MTANLIPAGLPDEGIGRPTLGWSASSSCSGMCPRFLQCTADLCALRQASQRSPAGRPWPRAWARASTGVSATTCPSDLHISAERPWSLQYSHMPADKPFPLPDDRHRPSMGPGAARRPGTAQPRRPGAAQLPTNAFHTTFSRGKLIRGKNFGSFGRGFASFQMSTRTSTEESVVGHFCGREWNCQILCRSLELLVWCFQK